jgi:hypothetical protein
VLAGKRLDEDLHRKGRPNRPTIALT